MAPRICACNFWQFFCCFSILTSAEHLYQTRFPNVTWDNANWILSTTKADPGHYQSRSSLANGYIGISLAALGPFFEVDIPVDGDNVNGWPLFDRRQSFATVAGFYDLQPTTNGTNYEWLNQLGGESVISGIPHWAGLLVRYNDHVLRASTPLSQITDFRSSLDIKSALVSWSYTWTPPGQTPLNVKYSMFAHKLFINRASVRLEIDSQTDADVIVLDVLDGDGALRTQDPSIGFDSQQSMIWSAVKPMNIPNVTAFVFSKLTGPFPATSRPASQQIPGLGSNTSSTAQEAAIHLTDGMSAVVEKHVGIASTDAFPDSRTVASSAALKGSEAGFDDMLASHRMEWQTILSPESLDDFNLAGDYEIPNQVEIVEQQIQAITNPFGLLQQTVGTHALSEAGTTASLDDNSIPVSGLVSDSYAGMIFWDSEVWMAPGLVVAFPEAAQQISNYRVSKYSQAMRNTEARETAISSQVKTAFSPQAAAYPWTSGRFGNCTGTGPCFDYEYHLNGDIALELENYLLVTGDTDMFRDKYFPIYDSIAHLYSDLLLFNDSLSKYTLLNATDPDEYANNVDNPAFTMVLTKTRLQMANAFRSMFGIAQNATWTRQADQIQIPTNQDANIILEYESMNGSIQVKQADVVLIDDLLDYENKYRLSDLTYYAGKQSLEGPGMTYGVFSIVASEAIPSGCAAYTYNLYGTQPYVRAPWFQYSEQLIDDYGANGGTHPAFPFLTGMGGANRIAIFGYLGLRLRLDSLNVNPSLPPQIPHLTYRKFFWQGHAVKASANLTHTKLWRMPAKDSLATANAKFNTPSPIPVTVGYSEDVMELTEMEPLVLENRRPDLNRTVAGNIGQCKPASSSSEHAPGQFPVGAVDGSVLTKWQPARANQMATLTVELGNAGIRNVQGFMLDWAQAPPMQYSIAFANKSDARAGEMRNVTRDDTVKVTLPYDAEQAATIVTYQSNTTKVKLEEAVWGGKYAFLSIQGNQANASDGAAGASVAEWAILAG